MKNPMWDIIVTLSPVIVLVVIIAITFQCSKHPVSPDPEPVPCEPVECEPCAVFDLTVRFSLGGNNSFPDIYEYHRGGFTPEIIEITSKDTSFTRVLKDYIGEPYGIRIIKGSGAKVVDSAVISFKCGETK